MTTETMNVHKAMVELKTLNSRIENGVMFNTFVRANKHGNKKIEGESIETYKEAVKNEYKSVSDMIRRHEAIKRAVVISNATTQVKIGDKDYSVAEAIYMKTKGVIYLKNLRNKLARDLKMAQDECDRSNRTLDDRAYNHVINLFGGDKKSAMSDEMEKERKSFLESQVFELVDPLNAKKTIEELDKMIFVFESEVDAALSVSNATTNIEVSY